MSELNETNSRPVSWVLRLASLFAVWIYRNGYRNQFDSTQSPRRGWFLEIAEAF
jgi:hypothetical protein